MDDTPILDISLKEYYNTIQKGGYVTRKKTESAKGNNDKSLKNNESIGISSGKKSKEKPKIKVKKEKKEEKRKIKKNLQKQKYTLINTNSGSNVGIHITNESKISKKKIKKIKSHTLYGFFYYPNIPPISIL